MLMGRSATRDDHVGASVVVVVGFSDHCLSEAVWLAARVEVDVWLSVTTTSCHAAQMFAEQQHRRLPGRRW